MSSFRKAHGGPGRRWALGLVWVWGAAVWWWGLCLGLGLGLGMGLVTTAQAQSKAYPKVGRAATAKEVEAWDIDVRPDLKGLPKGSGSVAKGMQVWEAQCASCHGVFGESNEVFSPLVGGTTAEDVKTGRVARLTDASFPGRTTMMKLSSVSTLWDYIHRAMPWTQPKSLATDEVYAVTAYLLHLANVVPDSYVLSNQTMAEVQRRLPNRLGTTTDHALWPDGLPGKRKPDVQGSACMRNCRSKPDLASFLPDYARDAHGNLAEQNRLVGAQRGADTRRTTGASQPAAPMPSEGASVQALLQKHSCTACHGLDQKLVGPALRDIAKHYAGRSDAADYLAVKIKAGGAGAWGSIPMPPQSLGDADAKLIAQWLAEGANKP